MPSNKHYLFLCGCPRSGTSELTRILATHPDFVIGMEKFFQRRVRYDLQKLTPEILEKDSFFNTDYERENFPEERADMLEKFHEPMISRYESAKYVGDKNPTYYRVYGYLFDTFPGVKIVCLLRNIYDVAHSWTERSIKRNNPEIDYKMGVEFWNQSIEETWKYCQKHSDNLVVCEYEKLYSDSLDYYYKLLSWLDVSPSRENTEYAEASLETSKKLRQKDRMNSEEAIHFINQHAKQDLAAELKEKFGL